MGTLMLLLWALLTPALAVLRHYHFVAQSKTWIDAQSYCREKFDDLATIESLEDQTRAEELLLIFGYIKAWIGVYDDVNSWRWSMNNTYLYRDGNTNLGSWFVFNRDNSGSKESCGSMTNGTLYDKNCLNARKLVCYDEPSNTYIPVTTAMTWPAAQTYCRETYTDLASMRSEQEKQDLVSATDEVSSWWIGLSRDTWAWSDQTTYTFNGWHAPDPNSGSENCGNLHVGGWYDIPCGMIFPFICHEIPKNVLKFAVKTDGSVDLNDPLIQDALLKEIKKRAGDLTMTWMKYSDGKVFNTAESQD